MKLRTRVTKVRIFYPADPVGTIPGGIDTFIRGILRWAPPELEMSLVGVSTDPLQRPPGRWTRCELGRRSFDFFPVLALDQAGRRQRIPLSLRFSGGLLPYIRQLRRGFDVFEFHRVEPAILFKGDRRPVNAFFHQNMEVLHSPHADNRWRHLPKLYYKMEDMIVPGFDSVFCVRENTVAAYQQRYPGQAERFRFIPTWMDPEVFSPPTPERRQALREWLENKYRILPHESLIVSVGRLDSQKNYELMIRAFADLSESRIGLRLMLIGDGVLREALEALVRALRLGDRVIFAGLQCASTVADFLRAADMFALSSAFEGMSMSMIEAMGTGIPVVSTDVGEVRRLVKPGKNGEIASGHTVRDFSQAMRACLQNLQVYSGKPVLSAARDFVPGNVLGDVFENYQRLHHNTLQ
jgi:glycosyltransferase involved in cell wall biosynthesis